MRKTGFRDKSDFTIFRIAEKKYRFACLACFFGLSVGAAKNTFKNSYIKQ
jgi:hypothetical protein